jgi:hypothetical protein
VMPDQQAPDAYDTNLRGRTWRALGMSIE